ncbi:uncharacterized protein DUF4296 [Sediminitomix flava]|uniref:Uncharacterized protein DUF4296 n=2 Tax=Sediminitomix flava TaxID=379075 RepID=A0A315ZHI5_SEDFL|nr:uncharacterized protein DUF4296 [Sediminitomix flava]
MLTACDSKPEAPEDILPEDKMKAILIDMHLAEASVSVQNQAPAKGTALYEKLEKEIFVTHAVDSAVFNKSQQYYLENDLEAMQSIYKQVTDSLKSRQEEAEALKSKKKK